MIIVRVELKSAITGITTEIARAHICNIGGTSQRGDYETTTLRGRSAADLDRHTPQRKGKVLGHARLQLHVWHLVAKALAGMGYGSIAKNKEADLIAAMLAWAGDKEGQPSNAADARLLKALWTYEGERTEACPECNGDCGEPCAPCTVAQAHAALDRFIEANTTTKELTDGQ